MIFEYAKDMADILKLVPIETNMLKKHYSKNAMDIKDRLLWMDCVLNNKKMTTHYEFKVLMVYADENKESVLGFIVFSIMKSNIKYMNEIRIFRAWYDHKFPEIKDTVWKMLEDTAKDFKIPKIIFEANRGIKAFVKTWKMKPVSVMLERKV